MCLQGIDWQGRQINSASLISVTQKEDVEVLGFEDRPRQKHKTLFEK
jgi:hypothetical protein